MLLQVSWCKLEVKLGSPKTVTAGCANRQQPPPLVVAALNLKTTIGTQASSNKSTMLAQQPVDYYSYKNFAASWPCPQLPSPLLTDKATSFLNVF